jgi:hypothetical protein
MLLLLIIKPKRRFLPDEHMEARGKYMDLSSRRRLVRQHSVIHGIDYLTATDEGTLNVYLIKPDITPSKQKALPLINNHNVIVQVISEGVVHKVPFDIEAVQEEFCIKITFTSDLPKQSEVLIKVSFISELIDSFFNTAEVRTYFNEKNLSVSDNQAIAPISRLNYLSKDYDTFKQLIDTELTHKIPNWRDRNAADMMIAINEVLAYSGDMLSYKQDAVSTEAYLDTARFQLSMQRHCRLLDYTIEKKSNARTWLMINVSMAIDVPKGTPFFCGGNEPEIAVITPPEYQNRIGGKEVVFEAMHNTHCKPEYNYLTPYDFGIKSYKVQSGSQQMMLKGHIELTKGQLLSFIDKTSRLSAQIIRLNSDAVHRVDSLFGEKYTYITWYKEDQLRDSWNADDTLLSANIVLVDRGETLPYEGLQLSLNNGQYFAPLQNTNLVSAEPFNSIQATYRSANSALQQSLKKTKPLINIIELTEAMKTKDTPETRINEHADVWTNVTDFLNSSSVSKHAVLDEHQGSAMLRFGNGYFGAFPNRFNYFYVSYRITPDQDHHVAAGMINQIYLPNHIDKANEAIIEVKSLSVAFDVYTNESPAKVKLAAPLLHRERLNMALADDYIDAILENDKISDVCYQNIWTGNHQIFQFLVYPKQEESLALTLKDIYQRLNHNKVLNQRFVIRSFTPLLLQLTLHVEAEPGFSAPALHKHLNQILSDDPNLGLFARKNFIFGTKLYASQIIQALFNVDGVANVRLDAFQTLDNYVGSNQESVLNEVIIAKSHEVICFQHHGRRSLINLSMIGSSK